MFLQKVLDLEQEMIDLRRKLHADPELSFKEFHTTELLISELQKIPGLEIQRPTKTGVVAVLKGGAGEGRTIALRADIDALPITEETDVPFASKNPGVMHACGHDGHTVMLLYAARLLAEERDKLKGEIRFIFQHAEELPPGGAIEMQKAGVTKGVDEIYGIHLQSGIPTGVFGSRKGALTSATDRFDIKIIGKGGHSAFPETCVDPMIVAGELIGSLQTLVSRSIAAVEPAVVSICMISAGSAYNIIPGEVSITGSTRTFSRETRAKLPGLMERIVKGLCDAHGATYEFSFSEGYASVINDPELTRIASGIIRQSFGEDHYREIDPLMPGEDFSAFLLDCPGFFADLGTFNGDPRYGVPHHNKLYCMDESALKYGVQFFYDLVRERLS